MRSPRKFVLPVTMTVLFIVTCVLFRLDQMQWEELNHCPLVELHEIPEIADFYEGYDGPGLLGVAYAMQLPGLIPVALFSDPMPLYIHATWTVYVADLLSIWFSWWLIGAFLDECVRTEPPLIISLSLPATPVKSVV